MSQNAQPTPSVHAMKKSLFPNLAAKLQLQIVRRDCDGQMEGTPSKEKFKGKNLTYRLCVQILSFYNHEKLEYIDNLHPTFIIS